MLSRRSRILIIEDNKEISNILSDFLSDHGYFLELCHNGLEAIDLVKNNVFDCIICDLGLPGADGFQVIIAIKASTTNRKTPIFVLSGLVDDQRIQKLTALKVADIILKPFFLDNVAEKIKGVVNPTHKAIGYQRAVIDLFEASASEVLKFYLGDVLRAKDSRIASKSSPLTAAVAIINLFGSIIYGSATFGCNSTFLNRLGEALFAQGNIPTEQLTPFAAEILNQIAGKIKARCLERNIPVTIGLPFELSAPFGDPHLVVSPKVHLEFLGPDGSMAFLEFALGEPDDLVFSRKPVDFPIFVYEV